LRKIAVNEKLTFVSAFFALISYLGERKVAERLNWDQFFESCFPLIIVTVSVTGSWNNFGCFFLGGLEGGGGDVTEGQLMKKIRMEK